MPSLFYYPLLLQLPLHQAGQLLLVAGGAFAVITLICSAVRFQTLIKTEPDNLNSVEDRNNFFFIQVARYLSKINRTSNGFGVLIIQFQIDAPDPEPIQEQALTLLKKETRTSCDTACLFNNDSVAALLDTDEEEVPATAGRIFQDLSSAIASIPEITALRAGACTFPTHGMKSAELIETARSTLEETSFHGETSLKFAPALELDTPDPNDPDDEDIGELSKRDKSSSLDPLTGVLNQKSIGSYMRKYLSDLRVKKEPAATLCVGINRIDHILSLHGEDAADAVIAGVSDVMKRLTRDSDLIGRFGRDNFFILATCSLEQGELIANRLREAVLNEVILFEGRRLKTSISIGIASHPEHGRALRHLFEGSHAALEVIRSWETAACLVYNPAEHNKKRHHAKHTETRRQH